MSFIIKCYHKFINLIAKDRFQNNDMDIREVHTHVISVFSSGALMWAYALVALNSFKSPIPGVVGIVASTIHLLTPCLYRFSKNSFVISNIMLAAGVTHQTTFAFFDGGYSSHILIWYAIIPLLGGFIAGIRSAILWSIIVTTISATFLGLHLNGYEFPNQISPLGQLVVHTLLVFGWVFISFTVMILYITMQNQHEEILKDKNEKIHNLFRILFHDMANPISQISFSTQVIQRMPDNKEKVDKSLLYIERAAGVMREITNSVKSMYAVETGKQEVELKNFSLNEGIQHLYTVLGDKLEKKNISLEYDFDKNKDLNIQVDPPVFKNQILANIVSNAIKFSPENERIEIWSAEDPQKKDIILINIKDHGIGMPKEILENLFNPNVKTSRKGTEGEKGTGFGMIIMKSFMESFKGNVVVSSIDLDESSDNHGSTFTLSLHKGK